MMNQPTLELNRMVIAVRPNIPTISMAPDPENAPKKVARKDEIKTRGVRDCPAVEKSFAFFTFRDAKKPIEIIIRIYYRNLLGGLYRENPVKSRNYEAVKSSKKWENVGNSYIIPALLLYRYSYI